MNQPSRNRLCIVSFCVKELTSSSRHGFCAMHTKRLRKIVNETHDETGESKADLWAELKDDAPNWPAEIAPNEKGTDIIEQKFEKRVMREIREAGFGAFKLPGERMEGGGVPDLLIVTPTGRTAYRELKTPNGRVQMNQINMMNALRSHGENVDIWVSDSWSIETFLAEMKELENDEVSR